MQNSSSTLSHMLYLLLLGAAATTMGLLRVQQEQRGTNAPALPCRASLEDADIESVQGNLMQAGMTAHVQELQQPQSHDGPCAAYGIQWHRRGFRVYAM